METKKIGTILIHAFIGWALCAATMGIGMATMTIQNALIIHAIGAPIFFTIISWVCRLRDGGRFLRGCVGN